MALQGLSSPRTPISTETALEKKYNRDENNDVRTLFMNTVLEMFGKADPNELLEKVRIAMRLQDYGEGKPLSARRILAVSKAISEIAEQNTGQVTMEKARSMVEEAVDSLDGKSPLKNGKLALSEAACAKAAQLLVAHGANLTNDGLRILANYVVTAIASKHYDDDNLETIASCMADDLKKARSFKPGDFRMAEFDVKMTAYWQDSLKDKLKQDSHKDPLILNLEEKGTFDEDGLYKDFRVESGFATFTIGGTEFQKTEKNTDGVIAKFKETIPNPAHRKAISAFMNQSVGNAPFSFGSRKPLEPTTRFHRPDMGKEKGFELFFSVDVDNGMFDGIDHVANSQEHHYSLEVLDKGNKAILKTQITGPIQFNVKGPREGNAGPQKSGTYYWGNSPVGTCKYEMEFEFDLSNPNEARLVSTHVGQTISPEIPEAE